MNTLNDPPRKPRGREDTPAIGSRPTVWLVLLSCLSIVLFGGYSISGLVSNTKPDTVSERRIHAVGAGMEKLHITSSTPTEPELPLDEVKPLLDAENLARGERLYLKNCAVCHGGMGQGLVGPNLTDDFWIHGGEFNDLVHIVREGLPAKGMIPWRGLLKPSDIIDVCSYVWSIRGRDVSRAMPPPKRAEPDARELTRPD